MAPTARYSDFRVVTGRESTRAGLAMEETGTASAAVMMMRLKHSTISGSSGNTFSKGSRRGSGRGGGGLFARALVGGLAPVMSLLLLTLVLCAPFASTLEITVGTEAELRDALVNQTGASPNDSAVITLTSDLALTGGELFVDLEAWATATSLEIKGDCTSGRCELSAASNSRVMRVSGSATPLHLHNLGFRNANIPSTNGGGVQIGEIANVSFSDCAVYNNRAKNGGGISASSTSTVVIERSSLLNNEAVEEGGGFYGTTSDATFRDTSCMDNTAHHSGGCAAMYGGVVQVENANMVRNKAHDGKGQGHGGGALYLNFASRGKLIVHGSRVSDNYGVPVHGTFNGYQRAGAFLVSCSNHPEDTVSITNSIFERNKASKDGGCMQFRSCSSVEMLNSTFSGNEGYREGGAIFTDGGLVRMTDCILNDNLASDHGGGVYLTSNDAQLETHNSIFEGNKATTGGAMYARDNAQVADFSGRFVANSADFGGGISFNENSKVSLNGSVFDRCSARGAGGGLWLADSELEAHGAKFSHCSANTNGGGYLVSGQATVSFEDTTFESCLADYGGAGHSQRAISLSLSGTDSRFNEARISGGAHSLLDTKLVGLKVNRFVRNKATLSGGGLLLNCYNDRCATTSFSVQPDDVEDHIAPARTLFENNTAQKGAAVYFAGLGAEKLLDMSNATFFGNEAMVDGAGLFLKAVRLQLESSSLEHNSAGSNGGGLYMEAGAAVSATETVFRENSGYAGGGAYMISASRAMFEGATFVENSAVKGGAFSLSEGAEVFFNDSLFDANRAENGAGLHLEGSSSVELENTYAVNNAAKAEGGFAWLSTASALLASNSTVSYNTADFSGGAVVLASTDASANLTDATLLSGNRALNGGGVLYTYHALANNSWGLVCNHCTAKDNSAGYGDLYAGPGVRLAAVEEELLAPSGETAGVTVQLLDAFNQTVKYATDGVTFKAEVSGDALLTGATSEPYTEHKAEFTTMALSGDMEARYVVSVTTEGLVGVDGSEVHVGVTVLPCVPGEYFVARKCTPCPKGTYNLGPPYDSLSEACLPCPSGGDCPGGKEINALPGWTRKSLLTAEMLPPVLRAAAPYGNVEVTHIHSSVRALKDIRIELYYAGSGSKPAEDILFGSCNLDHDPSPFAVSGTSTLILDGVATFERVDIRGQVGTKYDVFVTCDVPSSLTGSFSTVGPIIIRVDVAACVDGERFDRSQQLCTVCLPGRLALGSPDALVCDTCADYTTGLVCSAWGRDESDTVTDSCTVYEQAADCPFHWGNKFAIKPGYWVSPSAVACGNDTECLLNRVYECDEPKTERCPGNFEAEGVISLAIYENTSMCGEGYDPDIVKCSSCIPGYEPAEDGVSCIKCPESAGATWFKMGGVFLALVVFVALLWYVLSAQGKNKVNENAIFNVLQTHEDFEGMMGDFEDSTSGDFTTIVTIVLGYFQVMGLSTNVFSSFEFEGALRSFLDALTMFNLPVVRMLSFSCLAYHSGMASQASLLGGFYATLIFYVIFPFLVAGIFGLLYMLFRRQYNMNEVQFSTQVETLAARLKRNSTVTGSSVPSRLRRDRQLRAREMRVTEERDVNQETFSNRVAMCIKLTVFLITYMHPTIGATMFELFDCEPIHNRQSTVQSWVAASKQTECWTTTYYVYTFLAFVWIVVFVVGWPLLVLVVLKRFERTKLIVNPDKPEERIWVDARELSVIMPIELAKMKARASEPESRFKKFTKSLELSTTFMMSMREENELEDPRRGVYTWTRKGADGELEGVEVKPIFTVEVGDGGYKTYRVFTKLDTNEVDRNFGPFYRDFESKYYWWQCYEMVRRLLQTSVIIMVNLAFPNAGGVDIMYASLISVAALWLHTFCRPYKDDEPDFLQTAVLVNQALIYFIVACDQVGVVGTGFTDILIFFQAGLMLYAFSIGCRILAPAFADLLDSAIAAREVAKAATRRLKFKKTISSRRFELLERCNAMLALQLGDTAVRLMVMRNGRHLPEVQTQSAVIIQSFYRRHLEKVRKLEAEEERRIAINGIDIWRMPSSHAAV